MAIDLTPERLSRQLTDLDVTNREAAYLAGVSDATIYRWLKGETSIPASVVRMLDLMLYVRRGQEMIKVSWSAPEAPHG